MLSQWSSRRGVVVRRSLLGQNVAIEWRSWRISGKTLQEQKDSIDEVFKICMCLNLAWCAAIAILCAVAVPLPVSLDRHVCPDEIHLLPYPCRTE